MTRPFFEIPYYHDYISPTLARHLLAEARPVSGVAGLTQVGANGGLETPEALQFLAALYEEVKSELGTVLHQRGEDRRFIDERVAACNVFNLSLGRNVLDRDYQTILGLEDAAGRVVIGPLTSNYCRRGGAPVATLPQYLQGPHVTLFGPPDSAKMAVNAMNAYHRKLKGEPAIVEQLLAGQAASPMWGADDEDSKTPLRADLVDAAVNLTACFEGTLRLEENGKKYELAPDRLSLPIKRFPGLALPTTFLFHRENPIPLHLYDFALHLFRNWQRPEALVFYVPKLENEEEARYIHRMISAAERRIHELHPEYLLGTVRLLIVLENPRAILRAHEIMDALHPYFAGASLGWHDYLASTARIFKEDSQYRIPVKADPDIVIKYIKASHLLLAEAVGSRGGIKVGGMYGILPASGDESLQVTLKGFFKDVITQMKRDLTGFWVAHPDFVRLGLAMVEAWRQRAAGDPAPLRTLVNELLEKNYAAEVNAFIEGDDVAGLDVDDPNYVRSLIVADIKESDFIANHHPDEIRYNVFQSLQYLTDWLSGNGCVALPTAIGAVPVRVMDDLATAERSRWEVWHEVRHGRFRLEDLVRIAQEEMTFIRRDLSTPKKTVQVKWDERTAKWYPIAYRLMLQLMTAKEPVEFATELLMPFTVESVRVAADPWQAANAIDAEKFRLERYVADFDHYFEICGSHRFAATMAQNAVEDPGAAEQLIRSFSLAEVIEAASFHGNIGEAKKTLDARAAGEQAKVLAEGAEVQVELRRLGEDYLQKFGFKFLISAAGRSATEIRAEMQKRLNNSPTQEIDNARTALWEISQKRMRAHPVRQLDLKSILARHAIAGVSVALNYQDHTQSLAQGEAIRGKAAVTAHTRFELASLSKTIAAAFTLEYFRERSIPLSQSVNSLLASTTSSFRVLDAAGLPSDAVTVEHLLSHTALNLHYVNGVPADQAMPNVTDFLEGNRIFGYDPVRVLNEPGTKFQYSGGGFLVLEHLLESLSGKSIQELTDPFLRALGLKELGFRFDSAPCAHGYLDTGAEVSGGRKNFPALAAGALGTPRDMAVFLRALGDSFLSLEGDISHDTAVTMLHGTNCGSRAFMGCDMGLGVFTAEAGANRLAIHQGANDGFRALFVHCFAGPDHGKGFVICANGDNRAVPAIAEIATALFGALELRGVQPPAADFDFAGLRQEEIVNLGYKKLLFDGFAPDLPEPIVNPGTEDPLAEHNGLVGAQLVSATNQKFARAENLVSDRLPIFDPTLFCRQGKVMDSWESARHNLTGVDVAEYLLARPFAPRYASLSTKYHDGNQVEFVSVQGQSADGQWHTLIPKTSTQGHALLRVDLGKGQPQCQRVRVEIFPDGGFTRLGLYANLPDAAGFVPLANARWERFTELIPKTHKPLAIPFALTPEELVANTRRLQGKKVNLASAALGAKVVSASNEHYGPAAQVISPFPPLHMFDGMESARSRKAGHSENVTIALAAPAVLEKVQLDFHYFVNNNPLQVQIEGLVGGQWVTLVPKTPVKAFAGNTREFLVESAAQVSQIRVTTFPDGGINRIRAFSPNPLGATSGR